MSYILYLPRSEKLTRLNGRTYAPHPALTVYKERGATDGKKEILPYELCVNKSKYRKEKGYTLLTFRTVEDACYFNSGIALLKGIRFKIREWSRKDGLGAEIVIVPKEVFYGATNGGSDGQTNGSN